MSVARRRERMAAAIPRRRSSSSAPPMPRTPMTTTAPGRSWRSAAAASRSTAAANGPGPQSPVTRSRPSPGRAGSSSCGRVGIRILNGSPAGRRDRPSADLPAPLRPRQPSEVQPVSTRTGLDRRSAHPRSDRTFDRFWLRTPRYILIPTVPGSDGQPTLNRRVNDQAVSLAREWRRLGRAASIVALFTSPLLYVPLHEGLGWAFPWALLGAIVGVVMFRGLVDVVAHKLIPAPSLYGAEAELKEYDVVSRRRLWYWRKKYRRLWTLFVVAALAIIVVIIANAFTGGDTSVSGAVKTIGDLIVVFAPAALAYIPIISILFFANFLILFGPMLFLGMQQIKGYEPGDADWGVKLADVRGQAEAKEEITRVVSLWQSGEEFEKAGGKRERGVLFLGAPGTGKTMLSKAIATSFNCPFVTIPGSGFAQTFIGMDAVIVRWLARKSKKLAAKWGGQCIVFIDEIDAVGMRRQSLGSGFQPLSANGPRPYFGEWGARSADGDLVLETAEWREHLFNMRAEPAGPLYPAFYARMAGAINNFVIPGGMGGMGGGGLAL